MLALCKILFQKLTQHNPSASSYSISHLKNYYYLTIFIYFSNFCLDLKLSEIKFTLRKKKKKRRT